MFLKKNLFLGFILIISALSVCNCSPACQSPQSSSPVIISSGTDCVIVYSQSSSDYVVRQAKNLGTQIEDYCQSYVTLNSDWHTDKQNSTNKESVEILFGKTNRPESIEAYSELPEHGYIIKEKNGKIVIAASSEKLLKIASKRFFSDYTSLNTGI